VSREETLVATASQTVGPFFHFGLTATPHGKLADRLRGENVRLVVSVTDGDGQPVNDAMVELSQAGVFGRLPTAENGTCEFETIRPGTGQHERAPDGQAPHINVYLFARGLLRHIHTRIYFAGEPGLAGDPVLALVPADRRDTLLARPDPKQAALWRFEIRLQGPQETVFFDA
jgi:protocatechuate 3,4-dioxygenase alpha subunit